MTEGLVAISVFVPLIAAVITFSHQRYASHLALLTTSIVVASTTVLLIIFPYVGQPVIALGGWHPPLGIQWRIDGFAVLMLSVTSIIAVAVTIYAKDYFKVNNRHTSYFWPLWMIMFSGLNALFLSNDLFNWYVTLEILGLSAVALVTLAKTENANQSAFRYLLVSLVGSLCYLAGVALLYRAYGALDVYILKEVVRHDLITACALSLMIGGLLLKSAIFPLHFWLAPAHSSAPAPVSALLSALVVKGSFYIILRIWLNLFPDSFTFVVSYGLSAVGILAIAWGSYCALRTHRLKLLVAYSTVAQLGYLTLYFPLSTYSETKDIALAGVVYFIIAHALAKSALFLAAGNLQKAAGHDELKKLSSVATQLPMTLFTCALAGASIMGLPPSGGFIAKWTLLNAAFVSGQWLFTLVLAGGGLLSVAYIFRILKLAFNTETPDQLPKLASEITPSMQWAPLVLACAAIALGFNAIPTFNMLEITSQTIIENMAGDF